MNPCPCGFGNTKQCTCNEKDINDYKRKISGPIIDRIDMWIPVSKVDYDKLLSKMNNNENSNSIKKRVEKAREIQLQRFKKNNINKKYNSEMSLSDIENLIKIDNEASIILKESAERLALSARSYHRIIKLSQTIADLDNSSQIKKSHILEALQYRQKNI
jgi:magnesium chelatase family protein